MAKVLLYGKLEKWANCRELRVAGTRIADLLVELSAVCGREMKEYLFSGNLLEKVAVLVNGSPVRYGLFELDLSEEDSVSLMPFPEEE